MECNELNSCENGKNTFLFLYPNLAVGGIEKWIINEIEQCIPKKNIRFIWLKYGKLEVFKEWKSLIDNNVEVINTKIGLLTWFKHDKLIFEKNERVTAVCFGIMDFARLQSLRDEYPDVNFQIFYIIPHFTMSHYYPEMDFSGFIKKYVKDKVMKIYTRLNEDFNILYFTERHVDEIRNRYGIHVENQGERILKPLDIISDFNVELAKKRSERKEFRIITCGRFEFPHKGYMIGLINAYAKLKADYHQIKLDIIGYGAGENKIKETINSYPEYIQRDINLIGAVEPSKLHCYFDKAHLNISVAGGVSSGARTGIPSIPARHYTYDCQVYGYLPQSKEYALSDKVGDDVCKYIIEVIKMSEEKYIDLCKKSYDAYAVSRKDVQPEWIFSLKNLNTDKTWRKEIRTLKVIQYILDLKNVVKVVMRKIKKLIR